MPNPEPSRDTPGNRAPKPATLRQVVGAVLWSFFGVRKGSAMERDAVTIRPWQVVVVGVIFAALFVLSLIGVVRLIIANAT
jgi:hypothetical protein